MILCILSLFIFIYMFFYKKNYYNAVTYIFAGVFFPLALYLFDWSEYIVEERSEMFNYTFVSLFLLLCFYTAITKNKKPAVLSDNSKIIITKFGTQFIGIFNVIFLFLYLFENYVGSGMIFPALNGVDIHTYSMPIISYITNSPFVFTASDYYAWKATKKKRYLLMLILVLAIPVITRGSRMQMMMNMLTITSLLFFLEGSNLSDRIKKTKFKKLRNTIIALFIAASVGLVAYTNYRMNHFGIYNLSYSQEIRFSGPKWLSFLSPYYGYFPLSFNNLNINMLYRNVKHNYLGLYSFPCLYFGVFQLDNLVGIDVYGALKGEYITCPAAIVATGFWEYFYDYGYLCFIPVIVSFLISYFFLKNAEREKNTLVYRTLYFWYISLWFFMSFQNTMYMPCMIITGIILYFVIKLSFKVENNGE